MNVSSKIIEIKGLTNYLGDTWVHTGIDLDVEQGEILAIIGGSGSGKTTIFRSLLMLRKATGGNLRIFGQEISNLTELQANLLRRRFGILFQHGALFSSMTVMENIMFPMQEFTSLNKNLLEEIAMFKIALVGLPKDAAEKYPAELSGGMQRRAATARALAMDPELLFLDEPTTGLDPQGARQFDELILFLRATLHLTIVMISHDLGSLKRTSDRVAFLGEGKLLRVAPLDILVKDPHPLIVDYFN